MTGVIDTTPDPCHCRGHGPRHYPRKQPMPICLCGSRGQHWPTDQYDPSSRTVLGHQHGLRWRTRRQSSSQPSLVTGALDINSDPGCYRAMDQDRDFGRSPGLDNIMVQGEDHTDHRVSGDSTTLGHSHDSQFRLRSQAYLWWQHRQETSRWDCRLLRLA